MPILKRTPKNAAIAVAGIYVPILLVSMMAQRGLPSAGALFGGLLVSLIVGFLASGYLTVISGPNGFRLVDPGRTPEQMADANRSLSEPPPRPYEPTVNVDGTPMINGMDANGNPYGVTKMD
ncbi:hypothetical protein Mpe_B0164 (plasmid) [Methylibium petroleiphilum PM1]|uniref:Transmembrane protein n=2 Tax=Methylibium TaxID=316612 RepID=A2SN03_METPP|nr:hypothetical protein Mpe_B0164 [Methylibium petroleiphilum PM1]